MDINNINNSNSLKTIVHRLSLFVFVCFGIIIIFMAIWQQWIPLIVVLTLIILLIIFLLFKKRPEVIIFLCMILNFAPAPSILKVSYVLLILTFVYLLVEKFFIKRKIISFDIVKISWVIIILLGFITISKWQLKYLGIQWYSTLAIIPFVLYVLVNDEYISKEGIAWILSKGIPFLFGFIMLEAIVVFFSVLIKNDFNLSIYAMSVFRKMEIPGNGSNRLADILVFIAVFGYSGMHLWEKRWAMTIFMKGIILIAVAFSLIMLSRGALVALFTAGLVYLFGKLITDRKIKVFQMIMIAGMLLLVLKPFIDQMIFRVQTVKVDSSTLYRLSMWRDCLTQIKNGVIVGTGPGQYPYRIIAELHDDPHNMFLRYGVEFGGISMVLLMLILIHPIILITRKYRRDPTTTMAIFLLFAPAVAGTLMHSQMDYIINSKSYGPFFWLVWAIFVKMLAGYKQDKTNNLAECVRS